VLTAEHGDSPLFLQPNALSQHPMFQQSSEINLNSIRHLTIGTTTTTTMRKEQDAT
jgi:hypothetical protein